MAKIIKCSTIILLFILSLFSFVIIGLASATTPSVPKFKLSYALLEDCLSDEERIKALRKRLKR